MIVTNLAALGIGYVLGARAGRERYEQIRSLAGQAARRFEAYGASSPLADRQDDGHRGTGAAAGPR